MKDLNKDFGVTELTNFEVSEINGGSFILSIVSNAINVFRGLFSSILGIFGINF